MFYHLLATSLGRRVKPGWKCFVGTFLLASILAGCSSNRGGKVSIAYRAEQSPQEIAKFYTEKSNLDKKDPAYFATNVGMLDRLSGEIPGSIRKLNGAKAAMKKLQALSVSETAGSLTVNETVRSYAGTRVDRVLLHELQALNYLASNNLEAARVEMLQADQLMRSKKSTELASTRMLAGMIYEFRGEYDRALISYRKALSVMDGQKVRPPVFLAERMVLLTSRFGITGENRRLKKRFKIDAVKNPVRQIWLWDWTGLVSPVQSQYIEWWEAEGRASQRRTAAWIALPFYQDKWPSYPSAHIKGPADENVYATTVENIDKRVRQDLARRMPAITARAVARAVIKEEARKAIADNKENQSDTEKLFGALINIGTHVTEVADTRSWETLPSQIKFARLNPGRDIREVTIGWGKGKQETISLKQKEIILVVTHDIADKAFIYRQ